MNVTVVTPAVAGQLRVFPGDLLPTSAAIMSFRPGQTRAAGGIVRLATDGSGSLGVSNDSSAAVHVLVDVAGYFK